jgi:hypothetical protein
LWDTLLISLFSWLTNVTGQSHPREGHIDSGHESGSDNDFDNGIINNNDEPAVKPTGTEQSSDGAGHHGINNEHNSGEGCPGEHNHRDELWPG